MFSRNMNLLPSSKTLFCTIVLAVFFKTAYGIECYQCSSRDHSNPFQCNEYMTDDIDILPQSCDEVYAAAYCIKQTGRFEGGLGTKRFCSSLDLGNYCNYIKQPGDVLEYRSCVYTCSSDGCNGSVIVRVQPLIMGFSIFVWYFLAR